MKRNTDDYQTYIFITYNLYSEIELIRDLDLVIDNQPSCELHYTKYHPFQYLIFHFVSDNNNTHTA
jgi:hypothetical protein